MPPVPPLRRRPRSSFPKLTRTIKRNGLIHLAGYAPPENLSRREAEYLKRTGGVE